MISTQDIENLKQGSGDVIAQDGEKIGGIGAFYVDDDTERPSWVTVKTGLFGTKESFVPLEGARLEAENLVVPYTKDHVKDAPRIDADEHLEPGEEDRLYRHYGRTAPARDDVAGAPAGGTGEAAGAYAGGTVEEPGTYTGGTLEEPGTYTGGALEEPGTYTGGTPEGAGASEPLAPAHGSDKRADVDAWTVASGRPSGLRKHRAPGTDTHGAAPVEHGRLDTDDTSGESRIDDNGPR